MWPSPALLAPPAILHSCHPPAKRRVESDSCHKLRARDAVCILLVPHITRTAYYSYRMQYEHITKLRARDAV
jgi:hypothetical protein